VKEPSVGDLVDARYVLRREIARGAMGIVFEASHVYTGRLCALKLLHAEHAGSEALRERLLREGRALGNVRHRGIVEVYDAGIGRANEPFVAMEMLEGRALDGILAARRTLPIEDVVRVGLELCDALAAIHGQGLVHRDIKPSNLFVALDPSGHEVVKLIDFGIASVPTTVGGGAELRKLTMHGELLGTPEYMAPEQLLGLPVDLRADLYAVGVTLYECLAGDVPFAGTYPQLLVRVQTAAVEPLQRLRSDVPPALAEVVERALSKDPEDRFPSARTLAAALVDACAPGEADVPIPLRPPPRAEGRSGSLLGIGRNPRLPEAAHVDATPTRRVTPVLATRTEIAVPLHRRRHARAPYVTPVWILRASGAPLEGRSEDVSETGLLVITPGLCDDGEAVRVRFALPGDGGIVTTAATVRWARSARDGRGAFGLEFQGLPDFARQRIVAYVTAVVAAE
jgi:serine/threonine-protein kinase